MLCLVLHSLIQERHGCAGVSPAKSHEDKWRIGTSNIEEAEGYGTV